jgi:hypothetical protein
VKRALYARSIVITEYSDSIDNMLQIISGHIAIREIALGVLESSLRTPAKIHHDFDKWTMSIGRQFLPDGVGNRDRKRQQYLFQVVNHLLITRPPW